MLKLVFIVCTCALTSTYAQTGPSVNTTQGIVIGSTDAEGFTSFHEIHYAGNTTGENRFKSPTPPPVYPGEYHAVDTGIICAQPSSRGIVGVEDCLVLSIHTNNLNITKPVLVWIDGEEYERSQTTQYSFNNLVREGLLVVSVKYRLSVFGFLCLGVAEAPGNAGLKDITQALKWIQVNIANFGGDPNNVVLLGHGSGAAMVDLVTLSPMANGLVHKAIVLSGSALSPWAVAYNPITYAQAFGDRLGHTGRSREELANLLSTTDLSALNNALIAFEFYNNTPLFAPCVENIELNPNDTFLADAPINILRSGNYSHIPYFAAYSDREGTIRAREAVSENWLPQMQSNFSDFLPADLQFESPQNKTAVAQTIREFYFAQQSISMETIEDYLDYHGDTLILAPVIRGVRERANTSTANVRLLEFAYRGTHNSDWAFQQIPLNGVRHGGMLNFIFDHDLRDSDRSAREAITSRISEFALNEAPNPNRTIWSPVTNTLHMLYMSGSEVQPNVTIFSESARIDLNAERTSFWNGIYASFYVAPSPVSSAENVLSFAFMVFVSQVLITLLLK